jgi:hypothetical protein
VYVKRTTLFKSNPLKTEQMKTVIKLISFLVASILAILMFLLIVWIPYWIFFDTSFMDLFGGLYRASHSCEHSISPIWKEKSASLNELLYGKYRQYANIYDIRYAKKFSCEFQLMRFIARVVIVSIPSGIFWTLVGKVYLSLFSRRSSV